MENEKNLNDPDLKNVSGGVFLISKVYNSIECNQYNVNYAGIEDLDRHTIDTLFKGLAFEKNPKKAGAILNKEGISYLIKRLNSIGMPYRID